jgi:hypothetical protein
MKRTLLAALILFAGALTVPAQDGPTAPVKIVVPFAAGATPDIVARLMAPIPGTPAEFRAHRRRPCPLGAGDRSGKDQDRRLKRKSKKRMAFAIRFAVVFRRLALRYGPNLKLIPALTS